MLYSFFDSLRTKPKGVRDQYALLGAVCMTLIIGGVWSLSIPARLSTVATSASSTSVASTPLSGFFEQFKSQFKSAKEASAVTSATTTGVVSAASSAVAALGLQLTPENRQALDMPTTSIVFGTTTIAAPVKSPVATSAPATSSPKIATSSRF